MDSALDPLSGHRTYPRLQPHLPVVRRGVDQIQIGVDSADAVTLAGVTAELDWVLPLLDGCHHVRSLLVDCASRGVDPAVVLELLNLLERAGLLVDGGRGRQLVAPVVATRRVRLIGAGSTASAIAQLLLDSGVGTLYVVDDHPGNLHAHPQSGGTASNGVALASRLSGREPGRLRPGQVMVLNHWSKPDGIRPDITIVVPDTWECDRSITAGLLRADQPHLVVRPRASGAIVGPLVLPGETACLHCTDLTRTAADAAWPTLLGGLRRVRTAVDPAADAWAASTAVTQVLAFLGSGVPQTYGHTVEVSAPDYASRWRAWSAHPRCGCSWSRSAEWAP